MICAAAALLVALLTLPASSLSFASIDPHTVTPQVRPIRATPLPALPFLQQPSPSPAELASSTPSSPLTIPCTAVFPIERVEELLTHPTTIPQLEAAFGRAVSMGGRASRLRFVASGCTLLVTPGSTDASETVQEAELVDYASVAWLLERYGDPAAVGVTQGNLVMPITGYSALLYPDHGVIALVASDPERLSPEASLASLIFRSPYVLDAQVRRMNLQLADW